MKPPQNKSLIILMPTYNELNNLKELLPVISDEFTKNNMHGGVVIVDDNSPDKTGEYIKTNNIYKTEHFFVDVLIRPAKLGLGTAYVDGFNYIIKKFNPDYILGMDADFSHDPKYIKTIYDKLESNDIVIGSRYIKGGGIRNWKPFRLLLSKGASVYTQIVLGWPIKDPTTSFVGFQTKSLKQLPYEKIRTKDYGFPSELKYMAYKNKYVITEIPIIFTDRREGKSKMSKSVIFKTIINIFLLRFKKYK